MTAEEIAKRKEELLKQGETLQEEEIHNKATEAFMDDMEDIEEATKDIMEEKENTNLPVHLTQYLKERASLGLEELSPDDFPTPTLTLIQSNSNLVDDDGRPLPRGSFFYKGTKKTYKEVDCVLLAITKQEMPDFSNKDELVKTYVVLGTLEEGMQPFLLYLKRTAIGPLKTFLGEVRSLQLPMFCHKVKLTSEKIEGEKGTYYRIKFNRTGLRESQEEILMLEKLVTQYGPKIKKEIADTISEQINVVDESISDLPF